VALTAVAIPDALAWFAPVMLIKLLLAHLLPEGQHDDVSHLPRTRM
jgi:hypothetical protein